MKILLDAYFDNNFGDDLFADTLLSRYPEARFYVFWKKECANVLERARKFRNLMIFPGNCELQQTMLFDGYIMIGGDVLPDGVDYSDRIAWMRHVKENGGFVAMMGFSLYKSYGEKTRKDLCTMAMLADEIVIRDHYSTERFQELVPDAVVTDASDMAFTRKYEYHRKEKDVLGIAPRRRLYSTEEEYATYCKGMAAVADQWLKNHRNGRIRFFAFSTGEYDDKVTAADIASYMSEKEKMEFIAYEENLPGFINAIGKCSAFLPTRFHALVLALVYRIPFVPIPYEAKMSQLLDEVAYSGIRLEYGRKFSDEMINRAVQELEQKSVEEQVLETYQKKSEKFFKKLDILMKEKRVHEETGVFLCENEIQKRLYHENLILKNQAERLYHENIFLKKQVETLNEWVESLKKERQAFEAMNLELNEIRVQQERELKKSPLWLLKKAYGKLIAASKGFHRK